MEQFSARQEQRDLKAKHREKLKAIWLCTKEGCANYPNYYFVDGHDHYCILPETMEKWAKDIT
jgi:hypothetical protein